MGSYGTEEEAAAAVAAFYNVPTAPIRPNLMTTDSGEVSCLSVIVFCWIVRTLFASTSGSSDLMKAHIIFDLELPFQSWRCGACSF